MLLWLVLATLVAVLAWIALAEPEAAFKVIEWVLT